MNTTTTTTGTTGIGFGKRLGLACGGALLALTLGFGIAADEAGAFGNLSRAALTQRVERGLPATDPGTVLVLRAPGGGVHATNR